MFLNAKNTSLRITNRDAVAQFWAPACLNPVRLTAI